LVTLARTTYTCDRCGIEAEDSTYEIRPHFVALDDDARKPDLCKNCIDAVREALADVLSKGAELAPAAVRAIKKARQS